MPAYSYACKACEKEWTEIHGFNENVSLCPFCELQTASRTFTRSETIHLIKDILPEHKAKKAGVKTRQHIEEARQNLKDHKADQKR